MGNLVVEDMKKVRKNSVFIDEWKSQMIESLSRIEPDWDEEDMDKVLNHIVDKQLQLPVVALDNNFTGEYRETTLLSVLDWAMQRKPLVAGNATFYKNQHEAINPIAQMLDGFLAERKRLKKKMFQVGEEKGTDCDEYKDLDRGQGNQKILRLGNFSSSVIAGTNSFKNQSAA